MLRIVDRDDASNDERLEQVGELLDDATRLERQGDRDGALSCLETAIRTAHAMGPQSTVAVGRMLVTTAGVLLRSGRPDDAGAACNQALAFLRWPENQPPLDPVTTGQALGTLAHIARVKGLLRESADGYRFAIAMLAEHPGEELALTLSNFGALQSHLGQRGAALATYEAALEIIDEHAPQSTQRGPILLNRGVVETEVGWPSRALGWLETALESFRESGDRDREAQALHALADAHFRVDDNAPRARELIDDALAITQASPDSELHARCLLLSGRLASRAGDTPVAADALHQAARRFDELAPGSHDAVVAWRALAAVHDSAGDYERAVDAARDSVRAAEALRNSAAPGTPRRGITTITSAARDDLVARLLDHGGPGDLKEAVTHMEARFARELLDTLGGRNDDAETDDEEHARRATLRAQRHELERVLAHHHWALEELRRGDPAPMTEADLAHVEANVLQGLIVVDQQLASGEPPQPTLTCEEIQAHLGPEEVVIMTFDARPGIAVAAVSAGNVVATALSATDSEAARRDVDAVIAAVQGDQPLPPEALGRLSRLLVSDIGCDVSVVTVISDGVFHGLPWALLVDPHAIKPIGMTRRLVHVASVTTMRLATGRDSPTPGRELLVLADPHYTEHQIPDPRQRRLEGTARELEALRELVGDVEALTQSDATERNLLRLAPCFRRVHLSCHGAPDDTAPQFGGLLLAEPTAGDRDDGADDVLQPWEIATSRLACETVVLSACSSGLGDVRAGEGLVGLSYAFHLAGARQVLASLWPVGDDSTVTIMRDLYRHLHSGAGLSEALRRVRSDHAETLPIKQWSAWVAYGPEPATVA